MASSNRSSYDPDPRFFTWVHGLTDSQRQLIDNTINLFQQLNSLESLYSELSDGSLVSIHGLDPDLRSKAEGYLENLRHEQEARNAAKGKEA